MKTAVLGLNEKGIALLEAGVNCSHFQLEAVADKDTELARKIAERYNCQVFDDYRQLVMQNQLDVLLVAAPLHNCIEHIKTAMQKKFNILKLSPPGRGFEEMAELVSIAKKEGITFAVANRLRFAPGFAELRKFLLDYPVEDIFLLSVLCAVPTQSFEHWQSAPELSGGGVLLYCCYEMVEQTVANFGIPQQVYALTTSLAGDKQQRLYLTEDTALVAMKFSERLIGNLIVSKNIGQDEQVLKIYGKDRNIAVADDRFTVYDAAGKIVQDLQFPADQAGWMAKLLENFALSLISPEQVKLLSSGEDNLSAMRLINCAYLSGRTGMPEEPGRILRAPQA